VTRETVVLILTSQYSSVYHLPQWFSLIKVIMTVNYLQLLLVLELKKKGSTIFSMTAVSQTERALM
jgi:hypothetical protein